MPQKLIIYGAFINCLGSQFNCCIWQKNTTILGGGLSQTKNLMLEIYQQKSDNKILKWIKNRKMPIYNTRIATNCVSREREVKRKIWRLASDSSLVSSLFFPLPLEAHFRPPTRCPCQINCCTKWKRLPYIFVSGSISAAKGSHLNLIIYKMSNIFT